DRTVVRLDAGLRVEEEPVDQTHHQGEGRNAARHPEQDGSVRVVHGCDLAGIRGLGPLGGRAGGRATAPAWPSRRSHRLRGDLALAVVDGARSLPGSRDYYTGKISTLPSSPKRMISRRRRASSSARAVAASSSAGDL